MFPKGGGQGTIILAMFPQVGETIAQIFLKPRPGGDCCDSYTSVTQCILHHVFGMMCVVNVCTEQVVPT